MRKPSIRVVALLGSLVACSVAQVHSAEILNASYDVSRELFAEVNPAFVAAWKAKTGETLAIRQSHAGSSKQARAVVEGLPADVVTFNQPTDIELLRREGLVHADWHKRLPNNASPYYSFPIFLGRQGNPKNIKDWSDLARAGVQVVFPNPKTSGNGRYSYLGAYAYALSQYQGDATKSGQFIRKLLANVPVFDTGGRAASTTFVERGIGDVLITFESEVTAIREEYGKSALQAIYPSVSLRADFPVAVVDQVVDKRGTRKVATAYLEFLFDEQGQELIAKHHNRVANAAVLQKHSADFPAIKLVTIDAVFGGWDQVTKTHLADGGLLDQALAAAAANRT